MATVEGRMAKKHSSEEDEDDSAFWGPVDSIGDMNQNYAEPFEVRPFTSGSAVEEMFNFTKSEASFTQEESSSLSPSSLFVHGNESKSNSPNMEIMNTRAATTNSVTSAITELSQTDGSGSNPPMMLPFPFHGRPGLPHVDDFVAKCKLSYDHLRMMNNLEKKALILMKQIKAPKNPHIHYDEHVNEIGGSASKSHVDNHSSMASGKNGFVDDDGNASNDDDQDPNTSQRALTVRQIRCFVQYIQFFGEIDHKSSKYRGITYTDIETSLRMYTRSIHAPHSGGGIEDTNDMLMAMFDDLLSQSKLKPAKWFQLHSMEVAGNERKITKELFTSNVRGMCREHNLPTWTDQEMRQLRLHLSLDGQTEPTLNGVLRAFRRYHHTIPNLIHLFQQTYLLTPLLLQSLLIEL